MKSRAYRQQARAVSTEETRMAILDAVDALFLPRPGAELLLDAVAEHAGTTVQTLLRHFGTKAGLLEAAAWRGMDRVKTGRDQVPAGDLPAVEHCSSGKDRTGVFSAILLTALGVPHDIVIQD